MMTILSTLEGLTLWKAWQCSIQKWKPLENTREVQGFVWEKNDCFGNLHIYSIKRNGLPFLSYTFLDWLASENSKKEISNKVIYALFTFSHQLKILLACFTSEPNVYRLYRVRRVHTVCRKSFSSSALQLKTFFTAHNLKIFAKNQCLVAACTRSTVGTHSVQSVHWNRYSQKQLVL